MLTLTNDNVVVIKIVSNNMIVLAYLESTVTSKVKESTIYMTARAA